MKYSHLDEAVYLEFYGWHSKNAMENWEQFIVYIKDAMPFE